MKLNFDMKLALAIVIVVIVIVVTFHSLLVSPPLPINDADRATYACIFLCKSEKNAGRSLDDGPCISNEANWEIEDWVCDVAHKPRQDVDNRPENQCSEFRVSANHFVEVNPDCEFIRAV